MEPLWILLITVAPCLCNTRFMNWANDRANDVSLDLTEHADGVRCGVALV